MTEVQARHRKEALLDRARKWLIETMPEQPKCLKCKQPLPQGAMCTADAHCPVDWQSHVYEFVLTNDPGAQAKQLAKFAAHVADSEGAELEALREVANKLINYCEAHDWGLMPEPYDSINPLLELLGRKGVKP